MPDNLLFLDIETFSATPISVGSYRYAEDSEIIVTSHAFGMDGPVVAIDLTLGGGLPADLKDALRDPSVKIVGHNFGMFDRVVLRQHGADIAPHRIHDTMVQALSHGLPGSLDKLGAIFGVSEEDAKHKEGKALITLFCKPRPKNMKLRRATRHTHPEEWQRFLDYAGSDITAMRHIFKHMPRWNYPGVPGDNRPMSEYELWLLDQAVNDRGFKVDVDLARGAIAAVERANEEHHERTAEITDDELEKTTQRDKMLALLLNEFGVSLPDMTKSTLERRLEDPDLPGAVKELIAIRLDVTSTSTAKYPKLLGSVCRDGRLRGTLQFCGAARTGRDAGRIFQPQNLPRPDMKQPEIEAGIAALKGGYAHLLFDSPIKLASNALRGSIIAGKGRKLVVGDLEQIEARVLPWLAEADWLLDGFRKFDAGEGFDYYTLNAARVLGKHPKDITKEERQRYGKVPTLACGYGGSIGAFRAMEGLLGGVVLPDAEIKSIVDGWRAANKEIADWDTGLWSKLDRAARAAIGNPNTEFEAGPYIRFEKWRSWLRMTLPSQRVICFADAQIVDDPKFKGKTTIGYMGINPYTRQWSRRYTYGGKLSADCLAADTLILTPKGWKRIVDVKSSDRLWDGENWVRHDGLIDKGVAQTISVDGVRMTPDHQILTDEGWKSASQSKKFNRLSVSLPDGHQLRGFGRQEVAVERALRLWEGDPNPWHRIDQRQTEVLRLPAWSVDIAISNKSRQVEKQTLSNMERNARTVQLAEQSSLAQLWGTWCQGMRRMGSVFRDFLERYAERLRSALDDRADRQQSRVRAGQLPLGYNERAEPQHSAQSCHRHALGQNDGSRSGGKIWYRGDNTSLSSRDRVDDADAIRSARRDEQVYDIINAGPRQRFVVLGESGPMIVHNCTQATARDVLFNSWPAIEQAGFPVLLKIHDEYVTEPLDDDNYSVDKLLRLMTTTPGWADAKLPLAADGFEAYRYRK